MAKVCALAALFIFVCGAHVVWAQSDPTPPTSGVPPMPPVTSAVSDDDRAAALADLKKRDATVLAFTNAKTQAVDALIGDLADANGADLEATARAFLLARGAAIGVPKDADLMTQQVENGGPMRFVRFQPNLPYFAPDAEILVAFDRDGKVIAATSPAVIPKSAGVPPPAPPQLETGLAAIGPDATLTADAQPRPVCVTESDGTVGVRTQVDVASEQPGGNWRLTFKADGTFEKSEQLHSHASGNVFEHYPDLIPQVVPLSHLTSDTTLDGLYVRPGEGPYARAHADANGDFLFDPLYQTNSVTATSSTSDGPSTTATALTSDTPPPPQFNPDFLATCVYRQVDRTHELATAYGTSKMDFAIEANVMDPDGFQNACFQPMDHSLHFFSNSTFHPAADAGVVSHEYGHAILDQLQYGTPADNEGSAINEGFADFVGALATGCDNPGQIFLRSCGTGLDGGTNERPVNNLWTFAGNPPHHGLQEPHAWGELFSGLAWDVRQAYGPERGRDLVFAGIQLAHRPLTFRSAGLGLLAATRWYRDLNAGQRVLDILRRREIPLGEAK